MKFKTIITSGFLFISIIVSGSLNAQAFTKESYKYGRFLEYLERFYFDSVNADDIVEKAIISELRELDPHSTYITSEEVKKMNEPLQGNFEGIGISFNILNDTLFVITPIPGGPSEKVGIWAGDRILKVDGKNIAGTGLTNEEVFALLRGDKGTTVTVTVLRRNVNELLDFIIIRDKIPINSLDAAYVVSQGVGYIKLNRFALTTMDEFITAANNLKSKGVENLILDLTGNAGGYLDAAASLSDQFLDDEKLIVYTQGLHNPRQDYNASMDGLFENGKLVVLIDEGSASASEIVAGAIQDWDRGIIIGRRSFGKGLVQRQMELPDGSMVRLTVARYYTPTGRLIQKPYEGGNDKYQSEIYDRYQHGELASKDSIRLPDSLKFSTLVKHRTVFGGGGIMPDIFVPLDTATYSDYYRDLIRKGIINQFVLEYVDKNRQKLKNNYPEYTDFRDKYQITPEIITHLQKYAEKEDLPFNEKEMNISLEQIKTTLKSYIARDLWNSNEFYEIFNRNDKNFLKAVDVIKDWDSYQERINN